MSEKLYRFVNGRTTPLPEIDDSDFPKKYVVRVYGDDPRSGCIYCAMETAEEMRNINEDGYWEWLCEIEYNQDELWLENQLLIREAFDSKTKLVELKSKYHLIPKQ